MDLLDRIPKKVSGPTAVGGALLTTFANRLPEVYQDLGLLLGVALILFAFCTFVVNVWRDRRGRQGASIPEIKPVLPPQVEAEKDPQNWRIDEAMDYVADRLGLTSEHDIGKKFTNPARLLTQQAAVGKIHIWGKRIGSHGPELARRQVPAVEWRNRELLIWACIPSARSPQTRSITDLPGAYEFTDLHVNKTEIKAVKWQLENT